MSKLQRSGRSVSVRHPAEVPLCGLLLEQNSGKVAPVLLTSSQVREHKSTVRTASAYSTVERSQWMRRILLMVVSHWTPQQLLHVASPNPKISLAHLGQHTKAILEEGPQVDQLVSAWTAVWS
jgi:hypothetical protein